jgi:NADH-quinone oxidoreductase subunit C
MADAQTLVEKLQARFGDDLLECKLDRGEVTIEISPAKPLKFSPRCAMNRTSLSSRSMDVCGVDYSAYGDVEWATNESTDKGFSRGVVERAPGRGPTAVQNSVAGRMFAGKGRFAAVYQLLSVSLNQRVRVRVFAPDDELPVVPSVVRFWASANLV